MAVAKVVRAKDGETLCSIAVENGFKNCTKLRAANAQLAGRGAQPGDQVKVPEVTTKQEAGQVDLLHRFRRLGKANRLFIIQDLNKATGLLAAGDRQPRLAVSNYVPGRQGRGFAQNDWVNDTTSDHNADASDDLDHFKILVHDRFAHAANQNTVEVTLQAQKPVLGTIPNEIVSWADMTEPGTKLEHVVCRRFVPNTPWYRSSYLRLVADTQDQTAKRRDGHNDPGAGAVDAGTDVSRQTLIVPPPDERRVEILDLRVEAYRDAADCQSAGPEKCRARAFSDVGKEEKVMRVKVVRVGGSGGSGVSDNDLRTCLFKNLRRRLAQINVGVKTVLEPGPGVTITDNFIHDVSPPQNMIMISDFDGVRAGGGKNMQATVRLTPGGDKTAQITTRFRDRPVETAEKLATALRAQGVVCRVSPNPPVTSSTNNFGSCDILCFNANGTMARVISKSTQDTKQTIGHTGAWTNANVLGADGFYGSATGSDAMIAGSPDYRVCAKNFVASDRYLCAIVVNNLPGLNGEATGPYIGLKEKFRPLPVFQLIVFLSVGGAQSPVTLSHEGGHTVLDCFHTSRRVAGVETDILGNAYPNNANLAFSEWMSAFPHPNQIRKRISDTPLTVWLSLLKTGVNSIQTQPTLMGGQNTPTSPVNPTCTARFRNLCPSVFEGLRQLHPRPQTPL
jgi:hypothetical protein